MVLVTIRAGGSEGLGWTYAGAGCKAVVEDQLNGVLYGGDPMDIPGLWVAWSGPAATSAAPGWCPPLPGPGHADRWFLQRDGDRLPQLSGPRPHTRGQSEEYFLLLDGRVAFIVGEEHYDVEPGG